MLSGDVQGVCRVVKCNVQKVVSTLDVLNKIYAITFSCFAHPIHRVRAQKHTFVESCLGS